MNRNFHVFFLKSLNKIEINHNRMANNEMHDLIQARREKESVELFE